MQTEKRRELPWSGSEMAMVASFGTLVTLHLAAVVVLAAKGAAPVQYFSQAALLGGWCLVLVRPLTELFVVCSAGKHRGYPVDHPISSALI